MLKSSNHKNKAGNHWIIAGHQTFITTGQANNTCNASFIDHYPAYYTRSSHKNTRSAACITRCSARNA